MSEASSPPTSKGKKPPQEQIHSFWDKYITKSPGKVTTIFPSSLYSSLLPRPAPTLTKNDTTTSPNTTNFGSSYAAAADACRAKIARIVRDCHRTNSKFTDPDFDLRGNQWDCLLGLNWRSPPTKGNPAAIENALGTLETMQVFDGTDCLQLSVPMLRKIMGRKILDEEQEGNDNTDYDPDPKAVHRVGWIFEEPRFEVDGFSSSDIMQGNNSMDCWWLSAVATICHRRELMDRICVARDEECGVYGFAFYRDGGWIYTVVDDHLCLTNGDYEGGGHDPSNAIVKKWRKDKQTGGQALYFAACREENETWLPLLEKAYAKVHGDYDAIWGGWVGEGVEDLTGGVNSELALEDVLSKENLWKELANANGNFVFGLDILDRNGSNKNGLANAHAYSLLAAVEEVGEDGKVVRLVKIRNPWGERGGDGMGEWTGPWSDGSKEWTPYWLTKLDYRFEDDGVFWMTYSDMLHTFTNLYRTRLFDDQWTVAQEWTNLNVAWVSGYLQRKFVIEVKTATTAVFVLQQLDTRYFNGLEGEYSFLLHFILQKQGAEPGDYLCRVRPQAENFFRANRSINCEIDLEPGIYEVLSKITAERDMSKSPVETIVKISAQRRPEKLRQVGLSFDLAHAKALKEKEKEGDGWETEEEDDEAEKASVIEAGEEKSEGSDKAQAAAGLGEGQQGAQEAEENDDDEDNENDDEDDPSPWNAVAVIGLRVYSQDPELIIKLTSPSNDEEVASVVQGA
ncbi:putative calpain [Triangularia setosa]|uniref:Calpain n=1 Tax=Triangularia setosa TaxID=2587417 RepID=A0AAN6VWS1_9PEZI|nr:putative calpain [Podospora setosa]